MTRHKASVAVLGAGPAGCVAAGQLGQAGVDVLLIDADTSAKGHEIESLPPSGVPLVEDIGLLSAICDISDGPAAQMHMRWRKAPETRAFEGDGPLLLRREVLHQTLRSEALSFVRFLQTRVRKIDATDFSAEIATDTGTVSCEMVVDARGRHATKRPSSDLVALPFSAQGDVPGHTMWLEALEEGWVWACSLNTGIMHGALFQHATKLSGLNAAARMTYAQKCLSESDSFQNLTAIEVGTPGAAGLSAVDDPVPTSRHVLVGDAALARDPIASHGLVHAIRSGVQAAVAVRTVLNPDGDTHAAISFLRHKHTEAVATARRTTALAYHDQSRYDGSFWTQHSDRQDAITMPQLGSGPVTLANPLTRAPVLDSDSISWAPAIELPVSQDYFTKFGPVTALDIASACRPSAPLQDVATRLGQMHDMPVVFDVLEHLMQGGAFAQVSRSP